MNDNNDNKQGFGGIMRNNDDRSVANLQRNVKYYLIYQWMYGNNIIVNNIIVNNT